MADFKIKGANRRPFKPRTLIAAVLVVALLVVCLLYTSDAADD